METSEGDSITGAAEVTTCLEAPTELFWHPSSKMLRVQGIAPWGLEFRFKGWSLGPGFPGLKGFRVYGIGLGVWKVWSLGLKVCCLGLTGLRVGGFVLIGALLQSQDPTRRTSKRQGGSGFLFFFFINVLQRKHWLEGADFEIL